MNPVIPVNRTVCIACAADLAELGERECSKCLFESRFAAWAMSDEVELPLHPGLRFVGDGATKTFRREEPVGARPCPCGCGERVPVYEDKQFVASHTDAQFAVPRITEAPPAPQPQQAPLPPSREAEAAARRITAWVGLLGLWALASGWMLGRFG